METVWVCPTANIHSTDLSFPELLTVFWKKPKVFILVQAWIMKGRYCRTSKAKMCRS